MPKPSRRTVILGGAGLAGATAIITKPNDKSGTRDPYFVNIQKALFTAGIARPTLVIDRNRLDANIDTLKSHLAPNMGYRIVAKSLPSLPLLAHIRKRAGTDRLMTFNIPMLSALSQTMPAASQLLGKPMPIQAAKTYFDTLPEGFSRAADNIEWLIDTPKRLAQYSELANTIGRTLKINIELDVGLHRGGFVAGPALKSTLEALKLSSNLIFSGFMGYEPHIPAMPTVLGMRARAIKGAWKQYQDALNLAETLFDPKVMASLTRNAAGSPTYRNYKNTEIANEVSAGSCLVKPTQFDTKLLAPHMPASFIATPVIKSIARSTMPGLEALDGIKHAWDPNYAKTIFIYGGHWLADPIDPPGLAYNSTFGRSSNQEMLNSGKQQSLMPDEFVFLRPHQSETVFMQFGDIAVYANGKIVDMWPVFPASA